MNKKIKIRFALLILLTLLILPLNAYGIDGQIRLTQPAGFPIVIDQPGSYVLTSNLVVSESGPHAITIESDDVTIDLNGHAIIGPGGGPYTSGSGIYASSRNNIMIANGTIRGFGEHGIFIGGGTVGGNSILTGMRLSYNMGFGAFIAHGTIENCVAKENGNDGIVANYAIIRNCTSNNNANPALTPNGRFCRSW